MWLRMRDQGMSRREQLEDTNTRYLVDSYISFVNRVLASEVYPQLYNQYPSLQRKVDSGKIVLFELLDIYEMKVQLAKAAKQPVKDFTRRSGNPQVVSNYRIIGL